MSDSRDAITNTTTDSTSLNTATATAHNPSPARSKTEEKPTTSTSDEVLQEQQPPQERPASQSHPRIQSQREREEGERDHFLTMDHQSATILSPSSSSSSDNRILLITDDNNGRTRTQEEVEEQEEEEGSQRRKRDDGGEIVTTRTSLFFFSIVGAAKHTVGLALLLCVVVLWTLSNFLGSSIFADASYAKPFFLTYLNTSIFVFATIPTLVKWLFSRWRQGRLRDEFGKIFHRKTFKSLFHGGTSDPLRDDTVDAESEAFLKPDGLPESPSAGPSTSRAPLGSVREPQLYLGLIPTARLSLIFCLLWFGANYFAMGCLQYTTVASATILTSTASIWTLLIGAVTATEKFTWRKLCGTLGSLAGIILISHADLSSSAGSPSPASVSSPADQRRHAVTSGVLDDFPDKSVAEFALGDALALLSAIIYGFYTITLKRSTLKAAPLELHMPTFFGLVGLFNIVLLLPVFPVLHFTGVETFELPPTKRIWTVLVVNSISSFASDIMWAYAMVLTSPLVVTVGLSLTIPLSLVGEMVLQSRYEGWAYWVGAMVVVGSFVFVEREGVKEEETQDDETAVRIIEEGIVPLPSERDGNDD